VIVEVSFILDDCVLFLCNFTLWMLRCSVFCCLYFMSCWHLDLCHEVKKCEQARLVLVFGPSMYLGGNDF